MSSNHCDRCRARAPLAIALATVAAFGCGSQSGVGTTYPVSGKVTLDGRPLNLKTTVVLFKPDASRGNESPFSPAAGVDETGAYALTTQGAKGAPPGWYKVIVTAHHGTVEHPKQAEGASARRPVARAAVPSKYGREESTNLMMEVVEKPADGAYDLSLTSP
ncbi:MAG TPA: hypothetical protein VMV69_22735 [Pirellulales bacterium]|nr:hypothetical protein [Pirellulales bacterium]